MGIEIENDWRNRYESSTNLYAAYAEKKISNIYFDPFKIHAALALHNVVGILLAWASYNLCVKTRGDTKCIFP